MTLLEIGGYSLFSDIHWPTVAIQGFGLISGLLAIIVLCTFSMLGIIAISIYKGLMRWSIFPAVRLLFWGSALVAGTGAALLFVLLASLFLQITLWKVLVIALVLLLAVQFFFRLAIRLVIWKRYGRVLRLLRTLRWFRNRSVYGYRYP